MYAEANYTVLSRGRLKNRLYLTEPETDTAHHGAEPIDAIRDALKRSGREPMAISVDRSVDRLSSEMDRTRHPETIDQSVEIDDGLGW